ncbi:SH3 domain-containing protein [Cladochytrium replicatum]|nr:SH3 domain-containing protein [Cladochytrium replicatum]
MAAPPPRPTRPGKKEIQVVRALYDYTAQHSDELSFTEGTVLYVINKDDPSWWKCRANDKEGLVPSNYVGENTAEIENPLHEAAKRGNISFVTELLQAGVSVNGLDKAGNTALHWACRGGHAKVVELLLTKKPTVNAQVSIISERITNHFSSDNRHCCRTKWGIRHCILQRGEEVQTSWDFCLHRTGSRLGSRMAKERLHHSFAGTTKQQQFSYSLVEREAV